MTNSQKVKQHDVLVSNANGKAWYVKQVSSTGNMSIVDLSTKESERVSTTFANSCEIYRKVQ